MWHIGPICRAWRISQGMTQAEISRRAKLSRGYVCRFEKGEVASNRLLYTYIHSGMPIDQETLIEYLRVS